MSQQQDIESPGPAGSPIAKFRTIGQTLIGALVDSETRQQMKWKNGQADGLAFKDDGKPAMEKVLYVLVQPGTTAVRSSDADPSGYVQLEAGTLVRVILKGFKWGQYIEARNTTPGVKGEKTGDIVTLTYTHGSMTNKAGVRVALHSEAEIAAVPRDVIVGKDMSVQVARPDANQDAVIDACNAARAERKAQSIADETHASRSGASSGTTSGSGWLVGGGTPSTSTAPVTASITVKSTPTGIDPKVLASLTPQQREAILAASTSEEPPF